MRQRNNAWGSTPSVEHIELPDVRFKRRLAVVIILGIIAAASIGYIIWQILNIEPGIQTVSGGSGEDNCSGDLVLLYDFGEGETALARLIEHTYTDAAKEAYRLFTAHKSFEGMNNLHVLNLRPNETLTLPDALYTALELIDSYGDRSIFLAPIYAEYTSLFFSGYDHDASLLDPDKSDEQAEYFDEVLKFATSPEHIRIELEDESKARLVVSEEYLEFAGEYGIETFVELYRLENAFRVDYIAERLSAEGFTSGVLTSFDGYSRSLGGMELTYKHYDRVGRDVYPAAMLTLPVGSSLVGLRDFRLSALDDRYYYEYADGEIVSSYIAPDGRDIAANDALTVFSGEKTCAELILEAQEVYISDKFEPSRLDCGYVYCDGFELVASGEVELDELYSDDSVSYRLK